MLIITNQEHYDKQKLDAEESQTWFGEKGLKAYLRYLRNYGCTKEDPEAWKVEIGWDWAGFSVVWHKREASGYRMVMSGGLIYHEMDKTWSVNT